VLVIAVGHLEQVLRGLVLVRQDERAHALGMSDPPVDAAFHVGAEALLTALEADDPDLAGLRELLLRDAVKVELRLVQLQRLNRSAFRPDLQAGGGVDRKVVAQPPTCF
jgi:hypothetical protein